MFKKMDIIIIGVTLAVIILIGIILLNPLRGSAVVVSVKGKVYGTWKLNTRQEVEIKSDLGTNTLVLSGGTAYFKDSNCDDLTCQKNGKISKVGETIVCLPHKVVAEVIE